uniref:Uncharacterized protein n=1 Tax=Aegilops tauschii subsp. strangulata TaxID=200361 RepID=A0A453J7R3_AEGTS
VSADQLDVEAYAAQYSGRTRVARLLFIAERCGVEAIQLEALRMAHDEARAREDTVLYLDAVLKINSRLGPRYRHDQAWVDSVNRRAEQRKEKLETELNGYRVRKPYPPPLTPCSDRFSEFYCFVPISFDLGCGGCLDLSRNWPPVLVSWLICLVYMIMIDGLV